MNQANSELRRIIKTFFIAVLGALPSVAIGRFLLGFSANETTLEAILLITILCHILTDSPPKKPEKLDMIP